jgi:hypothetical protein
MQEMKAEPLLRNPQRGLPLPAEVAMTMENTD